MNVLNMRTMGNKDLPNEYKNGYQHGMNIACSKIALELCNALETDKMYSKYDILVLMEVITRNNHIETRKEVAQNG